MDQSDYSILIIAPNYSVAKYYANERNLHPHSWLYINHPEKLRGISNRDIVFVASWYERLTYDVVLEFQQTSTYLRDHFGCTVKRESV